MNIDIVRKIYELTSEYHRE